jgi:hypothetical protein
VKCDVFELVVWYLQEIEPGVCKICHCFGSGAEIRRTFNPSHGECHRYSNQLGLVRIAREETREVK